MVKFKQVYSGAFSAGIIATTASEYFGNAQAHNEKRQRYGSSNGLIITSLATERFQVILDGVDTFAILQPNGSVIIKPEDGIFFDFVQLTNLSGTNSSADEVKLKLYRAVEAD